MQKRTFLKTTLTAALGAAVLPHLDLLAQPVEFTLPALPYGFAALEPHIDAQTMEIHHGKHHKAYVDKLNDALKGKPEANLSLEALQKVMDKQPAAVRNNGGGHYNHSLFWTLLTPNSPGKPSGALAAAIDKDLGGLDALKAAFEKEAKGVFGSGWAWLCKGADGQLFITSTPNQDNPLMPLKGIRQGTPILALDVWEHAYYLKYQNKRADYISAFWNVVNWAECERRFAGK